MNTSTRRPSYLPQARAFAEGTQLARVLWGIADKRKEAGCPASLAMLAPRVGLEPTTTRLTAECSTIELSGNVKRRQAPEGNQMAPRVGLEPTTTRLTAECSTIELSGNAQLFRPSCFWPQERLISIGIFGTRASTILICDASPQLAIRSRWVAPRTAKAALGACPRAAFAA